MIRNSRMREGLEKAKHYSNEDLFLQLVYTRDSLCLSSFVAPTLLLAPLEISKARDR